MTNQELINGSGLFHFKSEESEVTQLEVINWYNSLPKQHKAYVDILRNESKEEAIYFIN